MIMVVHMASVWVPFTSESKEAIADYDEIRARRSNWLCRIADASWQPISTVNAER